MYSKINLKPKLSYKKKKDLKKTQAESALQKRNLKSKSSYKKKKDLKEIQAEMFYKKETQS